MPAPLGKTPTRKMPKIEVYGLEDSQATRGAIRFFRERRIVAQFVDLRKRPFTREELGQFVDALGLPAVLASGAGELGDAADAPPTGALLARIRADPRALRLPLVRHGKEMTAGDGESTWRRWLERSPSR